MAALKTFGIAFLRCIAKMEIFDNFLTCENGENWSIKVSICHMRSFKIRG